MSDVGADIPEMPRLPVAAQADLFNQGGMGGQASETLPGQEAPNTQSYAGMGEGSTPHTAAGPHDAFDNPGARRGGEQGVEAGEQRLSDYMGDVNPDSQPAGAGPPIDTVERRDVEFAAQDPGLEPGQAETPGYMPGGSDYALLSQPEQFEAGQTATAERWWDQLSHIGDSGPDSQTPLANGAMGPQTNNETAVVLYREGVASAQWSEGDRDGVVEGEWRELPGDGEQNPAYRRAPTGETPVHDIHAMNALYHPPPDTHYGPSIESAAYDITMAAATGANNGSPGDQGVIAEFVNGGDSQTTVSQAVGGQGDPTGALSNPGESGERVQEIQVILGDEKAIKDAAQAMEVTPEEFRKGLVAELANITGQTTDQVEAALKPGGAIADTQQARELNERFVNVVAKLTGRAPNEVADILKSRDPQRLEALADDLKKAFNAKFLQMLIKRLAVAEAASKAVSTMLDGSVRVARGG